MKNSQKYMTALKTGIFLRPRIFVGGAKCKCFVEL